MEVTRIGKVQPGLEHLLPRNPPPKLQPTIDYIHAQCELMRLPGRLLEHLESAELDSPSLWPDTTLITQEWQAFKVATQQLKDGPWGKRGESVVTLVLCVVEWAS